MHVHLFAQLLREWKDLASKPVNHTVVITTDCPRFVITRFVLVSQCCLLFVFVVVLLV